MSTKEVITSLEKLEKNNILLLSLSGGDPFMRKDIVTILEYLKNSTFWKIGILTNGTLITNKHLEILCEHTDKFNFIQFTIFSHHPSVHDRYTGVTNGFNTVMRNARFLKEAGIFVKMAIATLDFNIDSLKDTIQYLTERGYHTSFSYQKFLSSDRTHSLQNIKRIRDATTKEFMEKVVHQCGDLMTQTIDKFKNHHSFNIPPENLNLCNGLCTNISIDPEGHIHPCLSLDTIKIGNILDEKPLYEQIKECAEFNYLKSLRRSDLEECRTCKYNNLCTICAGLMLRENGCFTNPSKQECLFAGAIEKII